MLARDRKGEELELFGPGEPFLGSGLRLAAFAGLLLEAIQLRRLRRAGIVCRLRNGRRFGSGCDFRCGNGHRLGAWRVKTHFPSSPAFFAASAPPATTRSLRPARSSFLSITSR